MNKRIMRIGHVEDVKTKQLKPQRIGKLVDMSNAVFIVGSCAFLPYVEQEGGLLTTEVLNIEEECGGFWVDTKNSTYRLDDLEAGVNTHE